VGRHTTTKPKSRSASSWQPSGFDPQSQQSQQSTAGDDPQAQTTDDVTGVAQRQQLLTFFPRLKRSLADSKQLLALAKHVGVSQPACTAAFSQFLRDIHPAFVLPGQHKSTTDEAAHSTICFAPMLTGARAALTSILRHSPTWRQRI
jgi:hypothetical protein